MARAQRHRVERIEPRFEADADDEAAYGADLRLTRADRPVPEAAPPFVMTGARAAASQRKGKKRSAPAGGPARRNDARRGGGSGGGRRSAKRRSWLFRLVYWCFVLGVWVFLGVGGVVAWYAANLPPIQNLAVPARPPNVQIISADGTVIANRGDMGGENVSIKDLPPYVPAAFVAIEDRRFYSHYGIDPYGLTRAVINNVAAGRATQGGSTLTQQLAKNVFLTHERSLGRKVQEAILALWLEHKFSKSQILEMYINRVYFGAGAYGIEAASRRYFNKPARQLSLSEAATLAGLMKAPSSLAPNRNPKGARDRALIVLDKMAEEGFITKAQHKNAAARPPVVSRVASESSVNYPADWAVGLLDDFIGPPDTDVIVETTIDPRLQDAAERSLRTVLDRSGSKLRVSQGALVALGPDGAVRAMVGGRSYADSQFNRVIMAHRQPGSTFKPFVFLAALEKGMTPDTIRNDEPVNLAGWRPADYTREYRGPVSLTTALALSLNTVAVRLCAEVGASVVVDVAHRLGISSSLEPNPSISLGTSEVTPLEITAAYATFANGGRLVMPYVIRQIRTAKAGKVLYQRPDPVRPVVVADEKVGMMNAMMAQTFAVGTGRKWALPGREAAGKSGTSQNYRDAWFVGYTADLAASVWVGNDDASSTKGVTGGSMPAEIWNHFMVEAHKGLASKPLPGASWVGGPDPNAQDVIAAQPQTDGMPDDQPVAMDPSFSSAPQQEKQSIGEWIDRVLKP